MAKVLQKAEICTLNIPLNVHICFICLIVDLFGFCRWCIIKSIATYCVTMLCLRLFVVQEGLEPSQAEPESEVLPLHHWTMFCGFVLQR